MPSGYGPNCNPTAALKMPSCHQPSKTGHTCTAHTLCRMLKRPRKARRRSARARRAKTRGQEEESPPAGPAAERSSPQDSRDDSADGQSAAVIRESSPEAQLASESVEQKGQSMLHSAEKATVTIVDTCSEDSKAAANSHSMSKGGAHVDVPVVARAEIRAMPSSVRAKSEGESKEGAPSPMRSQVKGAAGKAGQGTAADCSRVKGEWVPLPGQSEPVKQSVDWQAAGGRKAKRQTAGIAGGNASSQHAPNAAAARQARLLRPQPKGRGAPSEPRGAVPATTSSAPAKASVTLMQSSAQLEQARNGGISHAGSTKAKADTAKVAKAAPAQDKHSSPSKSVRQPAALPEQPGRGKRSEDSAARGALPVSFADMARPAKALQAAPASQPSPPEMSPAVVPAQKIRPQPRSGAVARPVQYAHPSAAAAAAAPAHGLSPAAATAPVASMKGAASGPWHAAADQPTQQPRREPPDICPAQLESSAGLPGGLLGMLYPAPSWPDISSRFVTGPFGNTLANCPGPQLDFGRVILPHCNDDAFRWPYQGRPGDHQPSCD